MLRADNTICGTSTTGTGTLTLATCPAPPGGLDFYQWLTAAGLNYVNGNAVLVSYTIIEYTDATFATAKQTEKGIATLTLGASLTACTLARTTIQTKATGMNTSTPTFSASAPTAITIGTAANTLVFVGASADDLIVVPPYFESGTGIGPLGTGASQNGQSNFIQNTGSDYFGPFVWSSTMLVKKIRTETKDAYTGGTTNLYASIYDVGSNGRPLTLLIDFGVLGTGGTSLNTGSAIIASAAHATGFLLTPGAYFMRWLGTFTGGSGTPNLYGAIGPLIPYFCGGDGAVFAHGFGPMSAGISTGGSSTAPNPANLTGYTVSIPGSATPAPTFQLSPS